MNIFTWPPSAATVLLLWPIVSALISLVYGYFDGIPRVHAVLALLVKAGVDLPAILDAFKRLVSGQSVMAQRAAKVAKATAAVAILACLAMTQGACISVNPTVPVTPANQQQVSSCESTATLHNGFVLGGIGLGGASTVVSGVAAATTNDKTAQVDLAIGAAVGAGLAAAAAGGAGLTAASFTSARCTDFVTPLPMKPNPAGQLRPLPSFSEM